MERLLESVEAGMYEDLYRAAPPSLARELGVEATREGGALRLTVREFGHPMFNRIMHVGLPTGSGPPAETPSAVLDLGEAHYRDAGVRRWLVQLLPHLETDEFRAEARGRGLVRHRGWAKHLGPARGSGPPPEADLRVVGLEEGGSGDQALANAWARIVAEGFGIPESLVPWFEALHGREGWRLYLALDGDVPAAAAGLFLSSVDGTSFGHLGFAATLPRFRNRGAQSGLIAHRLWDADRLGADWIVSETDEELPDRPNHSYHNLVRMGLPVAYVRANWGPPKPDG
jgi:hypothetical protein